MKELKKWLQNNLINFTDSGNVISIPEFGKLMYIEEKNGLIIDEGFFFDLSEDEQEVLQNDPDIGFFAFKWGNRFYYCKKDENDTPNQYGERAFNPDFNLLVNLGICESKLNIEFCNLGVHTGYELLNGSGECSTWVQKAKFYKQKAIAIIDKNTLAGTLPMQMACSKAGLKSILGMTASIAYEYDESKEYQQIHDVILYAKNEKGWRNLLKVNKAINVDYDHFCPEKTLFQFCEDLVCIFPYDSIINHNIHKVERVEKSIKKYKKKFGKGNVFYQLDLAEYEDDNYDMERLGKVSSYFKNYASTLPPVYIPAAYYIESFDFDIKPMLNGVGHINEPQSPNQYFKNIDEIFEKNLKYFEKNYESLFLQSIENVMVIEQACDFKINTGEPKIPVFEVDDPVGFYYDRLAEGFQKKVIQKFGTNSPKVEQYLLRLEEENDVIVTAGFVDYFLILWDIIRYCGEVDILVGPGRGSAGGSLVAYLLGIIEIDPIEYNLLFERFLNKTRTTPDIFYDIVFKDGTRAKIKKGESLKLPTGETEPWNECVQHETMKSIKELKIVRNDALPDIDSDFEGQRRQDVKRYMEQKYGLDSVCSVGTYGRLKIKSALKDFARNKGVPFKEVNFITKLIDEKLNEELQWKDLFNLASKKPALKAFIQNNSRIVELLKTSLMQPKSGSIHASAVLILPKHDSEGNRMTIFDWLPVKKIDGNLVSEWEGKYVGDAGFLKEDILGIAQLDKYKKIIKLIEKNRGHRIDLNEIPLSKPKVMAFFKKGWNEDVFQFGTGSLKAYSKIVKPDDMEDLISMNALYRPGPMKFNAHKDFAMIKHGEKEAKFDIGMKVITSKTHGLYVFQEQIMQATVVGGLTLGESDQVRTYMKKFDKKALALFEDKFVQGMTDIIKEKKPKWKKERVIEEAKIIWAKLNAFSAYGFNKSHSAAYALMAYWCQHLKVNYPLEFWTASINFADEKTEVPNRLSEIQTTSEIEIRQPDINKSQMDFISDPSDNIIYWSLSKIKKAGDVAVRNILEVRDTGGEFFDMDDFLGRVPKAKVNRGVVTNLILAGAFDEIGGDAGFPINKKHERYDILKNYYQKIKAIVPPEIEDSPNKDKDYFWIMIQKKLTGYGTINHKSLLKRNIKNKNTIKQFIKPEDFEFIEVTNKWGNPATIAGTIHFIKEKNTKNGKMAQISVESNNSILMLVIWPNDWTELKTKFTNLQETSKMFAITGVIRFDEFHKRNAFYTDKYTKIYEL